VPVTEIIVSLPGGGDTAGQALNRSAPKKLQQKV
jgi:hypothetical protein